MDKVSVVVQADSSRKIAAPSWIKSEFGGFFVYDAMLGKVSRFDVEGQHLLSFGQKGKGPGEFQSPGDLWKFDNRYLIYDNNSRKLVSYSVDGNHIEDIPFDFIDFSGIPEIEALSPQRFVISTGGKNGSLLKVVNIVSRNTQFIGEAVNKGASSQRFQSSDKQRQAISSGNIPGMYKNKVLLSSNESGFFSFQQTTAVLEKYDNSGELIWEKNVKIPAIEGLFEKFFEENRARMKRDEMFLPFVYADGISANEQGVAVKLNLFEGEPVTIIWVPNDGGEIRGITFPDLEESSPVPLRFTISADGAYILFANTLEGLVYKADWPI